MLYEVARLDVPFPHGSESDLYVRNLQGLSHELQTLSNLMAASALTEVWNSVNQDEIREHHRSGSHVCSLTPGWKLASDLASKPDSFRNEVAV